MGAVDENLARGVVDVVVATQNMVDAHVVVVHYHGQIVGGRTVRAPEDHVVHLRVFHADEPFDHVLVSGGALLGSLEPDHARSQSLVAAGAVVLGLAAFLHGLLAHSVHIFLGTLAVIGMAGLDELVNDLVVPVGTGGLVHDLAVMLQTEPAHGINDGLRGFRSGTRQVRVLDAQTEFTASGPGKQPGKQCCPRTADMQIPGRTGSKTGKLSWS